MHLAIWIAIMLCIEDIQAVCSNITAIKVSQVISGIKQRQNVTTR